jgi:hypothetical protein
MRIPVEPLDAKPLDSSSDELLSELVFEPENRFPKRLRVRLLEKDSRTVGRIVVTSECTRYRFEGSLRARMRLRAGRNPVLGRALSFAASRQKKSACGKICARASTIRSPPP